MILRTAREQELPDDEMKAFISGIFDDVTDGWQHAVLRVPEILITPIPEILITSLPENLAS